MIYYDLPAPFAPGLEEQDRRRGEGAARQGVRGDVRPEEDRRSLPLSPQQSLALIKTKPGLRGRSGRRRAAGRRSRSPSPSGPTASSGSRRWPTTRAARPASSSRAAASSSSKTPTATAASTRPPCSSTPPVPDRRAAVAQGRARLRRPGHPLRRGHQRRRQGRHGREALQRLRHRELPGPRQQPAVRPRRLGLRLVRPVRRHDHDATRPARRSRSATATSASSRTPASSSRRPAARSRAASATTGATGSAATTATSSGTTRSTTTTCAATRTSPTRTSSVNRRRPAEPAVPATDRRSAVRALRPAGRRSPRRAAWASTATTCSATSSPATPSPASRSNLLVTRRILKPKGSTFAGRACRRRDGPASSSPRPTAGSARCRRRPARTAGCGSWTCTAT